MRSQFGQFIQFDYGQATFGMPDHVKHLTRNRGCCEIAVGWWNIKKLWDHCVTTVESSNDLLSSLWMHLTRLWTESALSLRKCNAIWSDFGYEASCLQLQSWIEVQGPSGSVRQRQEASGTRGLKMFEIWLVVWLPFFIFPYIGNNHPKWLIFFRGVPTTNQKYSWPIFVFFVG